MSKTAMPLYVGDVTVLARSLRGQLQESDYVPSHVEMLNLLVKAGGYRNFQQFKAQFDARTGLDVPKPQQPEINYKLVKRVVRLFDDQHCLTHWPKKYSERVVCLWVMWSRIAPKKTYSERELNERLSQYHLFEDHALLRRQLVDHKLMTRTPDGREYQRVEVQPPAEALEVFGYLRR